MNDNIRAMIQWILHVWTEKGIIDHYHDAVLMRYRSNFADVDQCQRRIAGAFDPYQFGFVRPYQIRNIDFDAWGEGDLNSMCRCNLCEVSMCTPIDI